MPLEELVATIEELKSRIEQHEALLRQSEALTRSVLIDPLLRALGWDTEDPTMVRPEYTETGGTGRPDYALFGNKDPNKPAAMLEAKSLGTALAGSVVNQAFQYCYPLGISYMVVANGDHWRLYDFLTGGLAMTDRIMFSFSIRTDAAYQCALKALYLWHPNLGSGQQIQSPPEQTIAPPTGSTPADPMTDSEQPAAPIPDPPSEEGWTSLAAVNHERRVSQRPSAIRFPDGSETQIQSWVSVMEEVAEYLIRKGDLTADNCPVKAGTTRYIVHSQQIHSN